VFERFYRGAPARSMPGSGLGLAIVRKVAEEHHGYVVAERADGGGAQLVIELPIIGATQTEPAQETAGARSA
jgi:two-component system, OmpR family, sensor histidine kinase MprB